MAKKKKDEKAEEPEVVELPPDETSEGVRMIGLERVRQIEEEGFDELHDDQHDHGEMAKAAACYAYPAPIFVREDRRDMTLFRDPYPWRNFDRREREAGGVADNSEENIGIRKRIDLLTKAGALVAAEIDRLLRKKEEDHG